MLVQVAASPNTSHTYVVFAETAMKAIHKLNYQLRMRIKLESIDKRYELDWLNALRRYKRKYKPKWGGVHRDAVTVFELPQEFVYSVSYFEISLLGSRGGYKNILPVLPTDSGPQEAESVG